MSDAQSHASDAAERFRSQAEERYGHLSEAELDAEGERVSAALWVAEIMLRYAEERLRGLRQQSDEMVSVWLERRRRQR